MSGALGVTAAEGVGVWEHERDIKKGAPAAAFRTPPSPNGWRQAADVPSSSSVTSPNSFDHRAGDGKNNPSSSRRCTSGSSSTSSHAASHTSSHYIFAIQRDLEAIVSLQQLQLQARRIPIPSQANDLKTAPQTPMGLGGHRLESTLATGRQDHISAVDYADPAMHIHSIDHAKKKWLEAQGSANPTLPQPHSRKELHQTCQAPLPPEPAGVREATVSDTALQMSIGSWQPSLQRAEDNSFSLAPHDISGASIPATHFRQLEPQSAPPPPPSASPIPASLVEYQRYLMQLEYQQRQHREVLRRHRRQRKKETISSAPRGAAPMSVVADTKTPPRQRIGAGVMGKDRRDRSPPLAMMMKAIRQRRSGECGLHSVDMLDSETSSSDTSGTASSVTPRRYRHSQKRSYLSTASPPTATTAPSRHRSGGRRVSVTHGRGGSVGEGAGASATTMEKAPVVALAEESVRGRSRQGHLQPQRWQKTGVRGSVDNNRPLFMNQQRLITTVVKDKKSSNRPRHMAPLRVSPPSRTATLEPTPIDPVLHPTPAAAAWHKGRKSSPPVEAFADALLMDVGGSPGAAINDASTTVPPQVAMTTATHVATAVGGTATAPAPILLTTTTTSGAPVIAPCEVIDNCLSEADMTPAAAEDDKTWLHGSRERQKHMRRIGHPTSDTNTTSATPAWSTHLSPSQERGLHAVSAERSAGMRPKRGGATLAVTSTSADVTGVLRHPGTRATAHSGDRQRPRSAEPTLAQGSNHLHRRVTRRRSPGAGATIPAAYIHPALTDAYNTQRYHHHRHHHLSMEGISSTTPEHGTGTPRSSRYRYNSSSTTRQRKHPRQSLKHPPCHPNGVETNGDGHVGAIKHSVDDTTRRKDSRAHRWAPSPKRYPPNGAITATGALNSPKKSGGAMGRSENLRPPPTSRSAAAIWRDVKLMWAPAPVAQAPFAAVYRYRPHPCPSTPFQVQQPHSPVHGDAPSSATAEATDNSARGHPPSLALGADGTGKQAPRTLARREGVAHCALSPSSPVTPQTLQQKTSPSAPPQCMTDSLIGAALRDVVPVCRARQREVAREVTRRRYQLLSTDVGGTVSSVRVY